MIQENNAFEQYRANLCRVLTQGKLLSAVETSHCQIGCMKPHAKSILELFRNVLIARQPIRILSALFCVAQLFNLYQLEIATHRAEISQCSLFVISSYIPGPYKKQLRPTSHKKKRLDCKEIAGCRRELLYTRIRLAH